MEVRRNDRSTQKRSIPQIQLLNRINYPRERTVRKQLLKHTSNAIFDQYSSQNKKKFEISREIAKKGSGCLAHNFILELFRRSLSTTQGYDANS
jgi:hypothetical protein